MKLRSVYFLTLKASKRVAGGNAPERLPKNKVRPFQGSEFDRSTNRDAAPANICHAFGGKSQRYSLSVTKPYAPR
jgi:hypothetical protein